MRSQVIQVVILLVLKLSVAGQEATTPSYEARRITAPIRIDGVLEESEWGNSRSTGNFKNNVDGTAAAARTEAKIAYDNEFIYFAFRCEDENIVATMKSRDDHLWKEEVVEVYLKADPEQAGYLELQVNPLGAILDTYLPDGRKAIDFRKWNSKRIKFATHVSGTVDGLPNDKAWSCEIALPFADIPTASRRSPRPNDRWRVNFYRIERKPVDVLQSWSPTRKPTFHVPAKFGWLIFIGDTPK